MDIIIEKANPADAEGLLAHLRIIGGETDNVTFGAEGMPFTVEQEEKFLRSMENSPKSVLYVAKADGVIIGDASLSGSPRERIAHRATLGISVQKKYWNLGIGSRLISAIIEFAKSADIEIIELSVRSDNPAAIHLYEKFGFRVIGEFPGMLKVRGENVDGTLMNLYL